MGVIGSLWPSLGINGCHWVPLGATSFHWIYWASPDSTGSHWVSLGAVWCHWVSLASFGIMGSWDSLDSTGYDWVSLGVTELLCVELTRMAMCVTARVYFRVCALVTACVLITVCAGHCMCACHCMCVCVGGRLTHTHTLRCLLADCENMVAWDKSSKTHPSRGPNTPCAAVDTGLTT